MSITFRKANLANADEIRFIAEIDARIPQAHDPEFLCNENTINDRYEFLKNKTTHEDFFEVAINKEQKIVGFHLIKKKSYQENLFAGSVDTTWVDPTFRGQGIALSLKQRGETWAKEQELDHIYTWVQTTNESSLSLNKKMGYEVVNIKLKKKI